MIDAIISVYDLFLLAIFSFFAFFAFKKIFIKKTFFLAIYYIAVSCILLLLGIGGGGVQNDEYIRLEKFIELEKSGRLDEAKGKIEDYDNMMKIDLIEFKNSDEFREYLKTNDNALNKIEAVLAGWFSFIVIEVANTLAKIVKRVFGKFLK